MPIQLLFTQPIVLFAWIVALVIAISFHEFAHAFAAYKLGDMTAKDQGRLTVNPMSHLSLVGTLMILLAGFGWGKPVPFNPYNLKNQRWGPVIIALAGPTSNLLLVILFGLILRFGYPLLGLGPENALYTFLLVLISMNAVLMVFNLIPIPPLDGSKMLFALLPDSAANVKNFLQQYGFIILIAFVIIGSPILNFLFSAINSVAALLFVPF